MSRHRLTPLLALFMLFGPSRPATAQWPTTLDTDLTVTSLAWFSSSRAIPDATGGVIVAWTDIRAAGSPTAIYAQRLDAGGFRLWAAGGAVVVPAGGAIDEFRACSDDSGGIVVTWQPVTGTGSQRVYAQRLDALGQRRWGASGIRVSTFESGQSLPRITGDGLGGVIVTWFDTRPGFFEALYAQRVDAAGNRLWNSAGVAVNGTDAIRTNEVATRSGGGIYLGWWCTSGLVRCGALDETGAALWPNTPVTSQAPTTAPPPIRIVADGMGGALVTTEWANRIYHRRLDSTGALGAAGAVLNSGTWNQGDARLAADGTGSVFVSWLDERVAFDPAVRVQKLRPDGSAAWLADGELAGPQVTFSAGNHAIVHDGAGGILTAYPSPFGGRAERLSAGGAPLWAAHPLVFTSSQPQGPTLVPTEGNGGIVVWQHDFTVRAKRILGNGSVSTVGVERPAPSLTVELDPAKPNPSRGNVALRFALAAPSQVRLSIHDAQGRRVCVIAEGEHAAGTHVGRWSGADASGSRAAPGLYFARLETPGEVKQRRLVRLDD